MLSIMNVQLTDTARVPRCRVTRSCNHEHQLSFPTTGHRREDESLGDSMKHLWLPARGTVQVRNGRMDMREKKRERSNRNFKSMRNNEIKSFIQSESKGKLVNFSETIVRRSIHDYAANNFALNSARFTLSRMVNSNFSVNLTYYEYVKRRHKYYGYVLT